jgi:hypothetical protein
VDDGIDAARGVNFLQLAQRAGVECGICERQSVVTALPSTVGATGSWGRVVGWINDAWTDVQMDCQQWDWMRASNILRLSTSAPLGSPTAGAQFVPLAGQATCPLGIGAGTVGIDPETFAEWDEWSFRNYTTTTGFTDEIAMGSVSFDRWRNSWMMNASRTVQTRPTVVAIGPDKSVNLGSPSNGLYTVTGDYFVAPVSMVEDTDIPVGLPTRYHMLIVYRTMIKYGYYDSASEVLQRGTYENNGMFAQLEAQYAPRFRRAGALA